MPEDIQPTDTLGRWASMAEILNDADIARRIEIEWRGKIFALYYRELPAEEVPMKEVATFMDDQGRLNREEYMEKYSYIVLRMLMRASVENAAEGFKIDEATWEKMPFMLRLTIFLGVTTNSAKGQESFLPSPTPTP